MFVHAGPREPVIAEGKRRVVPFWHERGRMTAAEAEGPARELPNARPRHVSMSGLVMDFRL